MSPEMDTEGVYDAVVIGAGQSGGPLSTALARAGHRTALVREVNGPEPDHLGPGEGDAAPAMLLFRQFGLRCIGRRVAEVAGRVLRLLGRTDWSLRSLDWLDEDR
jgi:2-polyprenyl-6-methoxyphenol hydroxylase-like FAD-dependent oxidoreductase